MGGGPEDDLETEQPPSSTPLPPSTTASDQPVLRTALTGAILGSVLGYFLGASALGSATGAALGASLAARDDQVGERTREFGLRSIRALGDVAATTKDKMSETEIGSEILKKISSGMQVVHDSGVIGSVANGTKRVVQIVEPRAIEAVKALKVKAEEVDVDKQWLPKVESVVLKADEVTGFSRTASAVKKELNE